MSWAASLGEHKEIVQSRYDLAAGMKAGDKEIEQYTKAGASVQPMVGYERLISMPAFQTMAQQLGKDAVTEDDLKTASAQFKELHVLLESFVEHCETGVKHLTRNMKQSELEKLVIGIQSKAKPSIA